MQRIPLTQGKFATVDDSDFDFLDQWKWCLCNGYAQRQIGGRNSRQSIYMHNLLMGCKADHKDGNPLNNRRHNLRRCTQSENGANRGPQHNNTSGFKGVTWNTRDQRWTAQIQYLGKRKFLGNFDDPSKAAIAYDAAARKLFGEFAYQNMELPCVATNSDS